MKAELLTEFAESFNSGEAHRAQDTLGSHRMPDGTVFRVWAPNAEGVALSGDFNGWSPDSLPMNKLDGGIWELFVPGLTGVHAYKYAVSTCDGQLVWKADPYALFAELRPDTASRTYDISDFKWSDGVWMRNRRTHRVYSRPLNIYEVHLGSWVRDERGKSLSYRDAAEKLIPYVKELGFTHIEFMPLTEYPYDASWGYQCTGYFAATCRYGSPQELMALINACHKAGLGVLMDWVPAHFPKDPHGLVEFDGTRLYEDSDPIMAEHPSWGTRIFDYAKGGVRSFLISSALFWLEKYHIDGLRVDAVASMLYLDYDRQGGSWRPNKYGGNGNLDAVSFLNDLSAACFGYDESILLVAEESTAWPLVTAPVHHGGLGFNLKWNMGWMNDTLRYLHSDPYFRSGQHNELTFSIMYAFSENFVLSLSHDEVVHLKGSIFNKAPGTREQRLDTVKALWAYMLAHPGKKLIFMGAELGQEEEWNFRAALPWENLNYPDKSALNLFFKEANAFYKASRPLWEIDFEEKGFSWICPDERDKNTLGFIRLDERRHYLIYVTNFSGVSNESFRLGVPEAGEYVVELSTDSPRFNGSGCLVDGESFVSESVPEHGRDHSIVLTLPPLSGVFLKKVPRRGKKPASK
ncbi:MAG: 1,4-alpha-glucan branching protein GlgB [Oscillospiraceae bacterium]|nr:1,4-alpha-glucan branching protein GlgB [Oscillospiraceae bacterium]